MPEPLAANPAQQIPATPLSPAVPPTNVPPPEAQSPEAAAPPAAKTLAERAREAGFADVETDEQAAERLIAALQDREAQAREAQLRAQQFEELALLRAQLAQQQQPTRQSPALGGSASGGDDPYVAPQVDLAAVQLYRDADGNWKPDAPLDLKQQVARYEAYRKSWSAKLLDSPREALKPLIEQIAKDLLANHTQELEAKTEEEAVVQRFLREADWAFAVDPVTNTRRRDRDGNFIPSPEGQRFEQYMLQAEHEYGITTRAGQLKFAQQQREFEQLRSRTGQQEQAQQIAQIDAQKKQELLNRSLQGVPQGGTFPRSNEPPARSQNPNLSLGQKILAEMQGRGVLTP